MTAATYTLDFARSMNQSMTPEKALERAKELAVFRTDKFEVEDIQSDPALAKAAHAFLDSDAGKDNEFIGQMVEARTLRQGNLTPAQCKGILNVMRWQVLQQQRLASTPASLPADNAQAITKAIRNGTYTVVLNGEDDYVTIRISDSFIKGAAKGAQMVSYLSGSNNEHDYTGFAFLNGRWSRVWKKYADSERLVAALKVLTDGGDAEAGERYALASGNCYACGRKLTVPASLLRGLGPTCAEKGA